MENNYAPPAEKIGEPSTMNNYPTDAPPQYSYQQNEPQQYPPTDQCYEQPRPQGIRIVPTNQLQGVPLPVLCPYCGTKGVTRVEYVAGRRTRRTAGALFFSTLYLAPMPYLTNKTKDVRHFCSSCGFLIATWQNTKFSGGNLTVSQPFGHGQGQNPQMQQM